MAKNGRRIWLGDGFCCRGRPHTCHSAELLRADESDFHDRRLIEATQEINATFARLRGVAPPERHLAIVDTGVGLLLIWSRSIDRPEDISGFVSYESSEEEIRQTLGLREPPASESSGVGAE